MIVDKNKKDESPIVKPNDGVVTVKEDVLDGNGMIGAYKAVRKILEGIKEDPNDPNSPQFFKTIKLDNGQLSRVKRNQLNEEFGIAFPAVFIHYINVYYNQGMSRVSEGKGTMRIHYVLNTLNNSDDEVEEEGMRVFSTIVQAIEKNKASFPSLVSRFQLQYWDQPLSFDDGLQPYWIDYQIWFSDYSSCIYRDYVDAYPVAPPFTNHSDQNEIANPDHLPDKTVPGFDEYGGFSQT